MTHYQLRLLILGVLSLCLITLVGMIVVTTDVVQEEALEPELLPTVVDPMFEGAQIETVNGNQTVDWVYKQISLHTATAKPHVVKTVYSNRRGGHLHPDKHFVLYAFHDANGTLERERMVYADDQQLTSSIYAQYCETTFSKDGKEVETRYIRRDGTVAAVNNKVKKEHYEYRADGKTLRSTQIYQGDTIVYTHFRLDGVTPWYRTTYGKKWITEVFFDRDGNEYEKKFERVSLVDGYTFGPDRKPLATENHDYLRVDGTLDYRQVWYHLWDKKLDTSRDGLGEVQVYTEDGKTLKAVYVLDMGTTPLILKGTIYSAPGVAQDVSPIDIKQVDPRLFHGFTVNIYGTYDDDSHDK
jgi:hypothetical protein